jgi:hypothetical protein
MVKQSGVGKMNKWIWHVVALAAMMAGCSSVPQFPQRAMRVQIDSDGSKLLTFDTNGDGKCDYWQRQNLAGRKDQLHFAAGDAGPDEILSLQSVDNDAVPHFIIALDGVPYPLVQELYDQGCFRLFYRPAKVVSSFPGMTDLAFQQIFGGSQPVSYQATHFDRQKNRLIGGNDTYLSGEAANWASKLNYRCSFTLDAVAYLMPEMVFEHELDSIMAVFRKTKQGTVIVYSVATAGLGTRGGREAILKYLRTIDQFCEQIVYERRGQVKITLLADHGHNMSGRGRVTFDRLLKETGYNLTDRLEKPIDVVTVQYGLVTYADFFTDDPAGVARVILQEPATTLAFYRQGDTIVAESIEGKAIIRHSPDNDKYSYTAEKDDPLQLKEIIAQLNQQGKVDADGFIDERAFFDATLNHIYPDPLRRVWQGLDDLVAQPADLIVCLKDGWVHGSSFFHVMIGGATSTHGSLNQINSVTFVMTMRGELPKALRLEEVMPALQNARHE